jgi:hypothetical protein
MIRRPVAAAVALAALAAAPLARAGTFDAEGSFLPDPEAIATLDFTEPSERYLPTDADPTCNTYAVAFIAADDALDSGHHARVKVLEGCAERFVVHLPREPGSYRASVWMRHGGVDASFYAVYRPESGLENMQAVMSPTGRTTSDGWVELATNDFPVDGEHVRATYLRIADYGSVEGNDIDAFEIIPSGSFVAQRACSGIGDPVCTPEEICTHSRCALGRTHVSVLPSDELRDGVVDMLSSRLRVFYGGKFSREAYLPRALSTLETMRSATTAWEFWNRWATAIHELHDWHTDTFGGMSAYNTPVRRLNACFFEGDADLSHGVWPKDPAFPDILVSHAGLPETASGLKAGDRLVAVDGLHPLAWGASLGGVDWSYHVATDPGIFADFAERLGGPYWSGGALLLRFATTISVIRCDASTGTCAPTPETLRIEDITNADGGYDVACDNRPFYHVETEDGPNPENHYIFGSLFRGPVMGTAPEEKIQTLVWDTLYGGGSPDSTVNAAINAAIDDWKANARGVILDHRAGNGGTLDAPENLTRLVRPSQQLAVFLSPMHVSGFAGPANAAEGIALFEAFKDSVPYNVGADDHDALLPVALVLHRDGSASDYLPLGMKGAPNVRIFGPHATSGAFSTFIDFNIWGGVTMQIASGDTVMHDGTAVIGSGVVPDEIVWPRQSDLLAGKDTVFEKALAWVRGRLKP